MLYVVAFLGGMVVSYMLSVAFPDTAVDTATKRANAKVSIPLALVLLSFVLVMGYGAAKINDLEFRNEAAMQAIEQLKGNGSPVAPTR